MYIFRELKLFQSSVYFGLACGSLIAQERSLLGQIFCRSANSTTLLSNDNWSIIIIRSERLNRLIVVVSALPVRQPYCLCVMLPILGQSWANPLSDTAFIIAFWRDNAFCFMTLACHLRLISAVRPTFDTALIIAAIAHHSCFELLVNRRTYQGECFCPVEFCLPEDFQFVQCKFGAMLVLQFYICHC